MVSLFRVYVVGLMMLCLGPASSVPTAPMSGTCDRTSVTVRLRKLHLVRPDLILYPLNVEVVC